MKVRIVVSGRSYQVAKQMPDELTLPDGCSLDEALQQIANSPAGESLPATCLVAVAGKHLGTLGNHQPHTLQDGDELVLLAPMAGG